MVRQVFSSPDTIHAAPHTSQGAKLAKRLEDLTAAANKSLEREEALTKAIGELTAGEVRKIAVGVAQTAILMLRLVYVLLCMYVRARFEENVDLRFEVFVPMTDLLTRCVFSCFDFSMGL